MDLGNFEKSSVPRCFFYVIIAATVRFAALMPAKLYKFHNKIMFMYRGKSPKNIQTVDVTNYRHYTVSLSLPHFLTRLNSIPFYNLKLWLFFIRFWLNNLIENSQMKTKSVLHSEWRKKCLSNIKSSKQCICGIHANDATKTGHRCQALDIFRWCLCVTNTPIYIRKYHNFF